MKKQCGILVAVLPRSGILKEVYTMIWAKEETLPRDEIEAIQFAKLKGTVRYIYDRVSLTVRKWMRQG